ncbi:MAG: hypothetical protein GY906_03675 [bacterium]|nr:hypothetical protein [bacterium]
MPYKVKGSSIRSKFKFVHDRFGADAENELREEFAGRRDLFPLLDSSWYPFSLYNEIICKIAERFYNGKLEALKEVGAFSAEEALTTVYRAYVASKNYVSFLRRIERLHQTLYSAGSMTVTVGRDGTSTLIEQHGAPVYSEADLHVAAGFYVGAGQLLGHHDISCHLDKGKAGANFELRWGRREN